MNSVKDKLPEDKQVVLIYTNEDNVFGYNNELMRFHVATFLRGRTESEVIRDRIQSFPDQCGNNLVPYRWQGDGPCSYFGQEVTHWDYLPKEPKP